MFKDKLNNLKELFTKKTEGNNKKQIENLVIFLIILIITIIAINVIWNGDKKKTTDNNTSTEYKQLAEDINQNINSTISENDEYNLENKLEDILSNISGVGKVKVLITYSQTSTVVAMTNETNTYSNTEETDSNGGTRNILETDTKSEVIFEEKDGESVPITEKIIMPKIEGAIITAEGAGDAVIKTNIVQAVSAVTGLASYRVQVFEMDKN